MNDYLYLFAYYVINLALLATVMNNETRQLLLQISNLLLPLKTKELRRF